MDISTITNFIKLPKRIIFIICILSAVLLFSDDPFLKKMALYDFRENYKIWIGITFMFSMSISILNIVEYVIKFLKNKIFLRYLNKAIKKEELQLIEFMNKLDNDELSAIREFIIQKKNTIEMSIDDHSVVGLIQKEIIRQVGKEGYQTTLTDRICYFKLADIAKEHIKTINFSQYKHISRPKWIEQIAAQERMGKQKSELLKMIM